MPRYLAIDYGSKRIGLAISGGTAIASPLKTIAACGRPAGDVAAVLSATTDFDFDVFVIGLPLNMDGSEGAQAKIARGFGEELAARCGKPVEYWDERLSSVAAAEKLGAGSPARSAKKARIDGVAAQVILEDYLAARHPAMQPEAGDDDDSGSGAGRS